MAELTRTEAAHLISGSTAPTREDKIVEAYERAGLYVPTDFVISPFDELMLDMAKIRTRRVTTADMANAVRQGFIDLKYPSVEFDDSSINNYFDALRGKIPGKNWDDSQALWNAGELREYVFPEVRQRYNVAHMLQMARVEGLEVPPYKTEVQLAAAHMFADGVSFEDMDAELNTIYTSYIRDSLLLDLTELFPEDLETTILSSVERYETVVESSTLAEPYKAEIRKGRYLAGSGYPLSGYVAEAVGKLWLEKFYENPALFAPLALKTNPSKRNYVERAARMFIQGGSAAANSWAIENGTNQRLAMVNPRLGSFIVEMSFGLPNPVYPAIDMVDAAANYMKKRMTRGQ